MIANDKELESTWAAIRSVSGMIQSLKRQYEGTAHPSQLCLLLEGHVLELARLQAEADDYLGVAAAREMRVPLWIRIAGDDIEPGEGALHFMTEVLEKFQGAVRKLAELAATGTLGKRPTGEVIAATNLSPLVLAPGSLRIGLAPVVPHQAKLSLVEGKPPLTAETGLRVLVDVANESASASAPDLPGDLRRVALHEIVRMAPSGRTAVKLINFSGRLVGAPVSLTRETREWANSKLKGATVPDTKTFEGDIRELDLDNQTFTLRNVDKKDELFELPCKVEAEELMLVRDALDVRVKVTGLMAPDSAGRGAQKYLKVIAIEPVDDDVELMATRE